MQHETFVASKFNISLSFSQKNIQLALKLGTKYFIPDYT